MEPDVSYGQKASFDETPSELTMLFNEIRALMDEVAGSTTELLEHKLELVLRPSESMDEVNRMQPETVKPPQTSLNMTLTEVRDRLKHHSRALIHLAHRIEL